MIPVGIGRRISVLKKIMVGLLAFCCCGVNLAYIVDGSRINRPKLLSFAKEKLQNQGTIEQAKNGFTYVKLPDSYVYELINHSYQADFNLPRYKTNELKNGALISVIAADESRNIQQLQEVGTVVQFKPLGFYTIVDHDKEYFMLAVDAPELSNIRLKYGLSEKLSNHAFSITVGVRQLTAENELEP